MIFSPVGKTTLGVGVMSLSGKKQRENNSLHEPKVTVKPTILVELGQMSEIRLQKLAKPMGHTIT